MRKRGRTDANQPAIVKALRKRGAEVWVTSGCGDGAPDLVVGFEDHTFLIEVKDGAKVPSKRNLTEEEALFHKQWLTKGVTIWIIESVADALALLDFQNGIDALC